MIWLVYIPILSYTQNVIPVRFVAQRVWNVSSCWDLRMEPGFWKSWPIDGFVQKWDITWHHHFDAKQWILGYSNSNPILRENCRCENHKRPCRHGVSQAQFIRWDLQGKWSCQMSDVRHIYLGILPRHDQEVEEKCHWSIRSLDLKFHRTGTFGSAFWEFLECQHACWFSKVGKLSKVVSIDKTCVSHFQQSDKWLNMYSTPLKRLIKTMDFL